MSLVGGISVVFLGKQPDCGKRICVFSMLKTKMEVDIRLCFHFKQVRIWLNFQRQPATRMCLKENSAITVPSCTLRKLLPKCEKRTAPFATAFVFSQNRRARLWLKFFIAAMVNCSGTCLPLQQNRRNQNDWKQYCKDSPLFVFAAQNTPTNAENLKDQTVTMLLWKARSLQGKTAHCRSETCSQELLGTFPKIVAKLQVTQVVVTVTWVLNNKLRPKHTYVNTSSVISSKTTRTSC